MSLRDQLRRAVHPELHVASPRACNRATPAPIVQQAVQHPCNSRTAPPGVSSELHATGHATTTQLASCTGLAIGPLNATEVAPIRDHRAELLSLLAPSPAADPDRWCWPHSDAVNGAELALFAERVQAFTRCGISTEAAEVMADRFVTRDRERDDRHTCLECVSYRPGRCGNYRRAGLNAAEVGRDLAALLQRCLGFNPSK